MRPRAFASIEDFASQVGKNLGSADGGTLLHHQRALAQRMHRHATERILRFGRTEFHAALSFGSRNCAVICAMIATATSPGDIAPMGSPIGA